MSETPTADTHTPHASTTGEGRNSPSSPVCFSNDVEADLEERLAMDITEDAVTSENALSMHAVEDSDSTPRSEAPTASDITSLPDLYSSSPQATVGAAEGSYFAPRPQYRTATFLSTSAAGSTASSPSHSANASTTSVQNVQQDENVHGRTAYPLGLNSLRDPSLAPTTPAAATCAVAVPPVVPILRATTPHGSRDDGPHFPNQAYAALQSQFHPPPYLPHGIRTRNLHPSQYGAASVPITTPNDAVADPGSWTVGNSPAPSPGLFTPSTPLSRPTHAQSDEEGFYASPYLHYTHRQAPKETHTAEVDVDPISGRKIINQYEILDIIGRGTHGKVKLGRDLHTGNHVAIKIVERYSKRRRLGRLGNPEDKVKKEVAILKKARHPNVVALLEVIDDPMKKKVYIVLEFVELGEIQWRTEGAKEITLIEARRFDREARGIFEDASAEISDANLIREASRRRRRKEKQKWRMQRSQTSQTVQSWSLEQGGDTEDDEDSEFDRYSHASGTAPGTRDVSVRSSRTTSRSTTPLPTDLDIGPLDSNNEDERLSNRSHTSHSQRMNDLPPCQTGLEGTMYGAYDVELPRGRAPSVAGSTVSEIPEILENPLHKDLKFVPVMTLQQIRSAIRDTVLGLDYLHYQGIIHRDIKPANLLQARDHHVKISDFGVSYLGRPEQGGHLEDLSESDAQELDGAVELAKTVGTPAFYAPELCYTEEREDAPPVTGQIDIWALGVTLYCLLYGRPPFVDDNPFVVMRMIAEREVYIPRKRLKPVDTASSSRPNSHGRRYTMNSNKRLAHELVYEAIDDDLYDLLKRLLTKDPRKRITLREVKHHPWLISDINNPIAWLDETDPSRQSQGRKIEVSKEDMAEAVVPISMVERVRSGIKRLGGALGLSRTTFRKRATSSVASSENNQLSANSSSSTISQDARRGSIKGDDQIINALKASKEEHPLSHSVTASPEIKDEDSYFQTPVTHRASSPQILTQIKDRIHNLSISQPRPAMPDRAQSNLSTSASIRTIKQSDIPGAKRVTTPPLSPGLPGTPMALDTPGGTNLGGLFGGPARGIFKNVRRSKERLFNRNETELRSKSTDRVTGAFEDAHGEPSIAFSNAFASGHVDHALKDSSPSGSSYVSPTSSRNQSIVAAADLLQPLGELSRKNSIASSTSLSRPSTATTPEKRISHQVSSSISEVPEETAEEGFERAQQELIRKKQFEATQARERPPSALSQRPESAMSQGPCPPSPDDHTYHEQQLEEQRRLRLQHTGSNVTSADQSPTSGPSYLLPITSSSSEDRFTNALSQSTSNPSIPSVVSADSSIMPDDCSLFGLNDASDATTRPSFKVADDYEGYYGDHAVESDDVDDSDDSGEDFIMMTKHKKMGRAGSISNAELARRRVRRETGHSSIKSTRSGSNGTVKKIRSPSIGSDDGRGRTLRSAPLPDEDHGRHERP